jgi:hypothetical protein
MRFLGLVLGLFLFASQANAAIILTIGSGSFAQDSGVQFVDVFARSDAAELTDFLVADFNLGGASFNSPAAGTFGFAGAIGAGNLQGTSSFLVDGSDATGRTSNLSLDFTAPQLFPNADTLIARLAINTNGAAAGTFNITGANFATLAGVNTVNAGSFSIITAVPEPTSMALVGLVFGGIAGRRALKRFRKVA